MVLAQCQEEFMKSLPIFSLRNDNNQSLLPEFCPPASYLLIELSPINAPERMLRFRDRIN
jgi:hypothetical protein